eukprot:s395_g5.t1
MAFSVSVALLSGRRAELRLPIGATVDDLRWLAEKELSVGIDVLILESGRCLAPSEKLADAGVEDGSTVTAKVRGVCIAATTSAFAQLAADGSVQTTGNSRFGGDSSAVQAQLNNVEPLLLLMEQICASEASFAAIRSDGSVVVWGSGLGVDDFPGVQHLLRNVRQIQATDDAFAALCADGCSAELGVSEFERRAVQHRCRDVVQIAANRGAFAAIRADGEVVPWGGVKRGGVCATAPRQVTQIQASVAAFAAIGADAGR